MQGCTDFRITTWMASFMAPITPEALVHTIRVQPGPNLEAVSLIAVAERQSQAGLLGVNVVLSHRKTSNSFIKEINDTRGSNVKKCHFKSLRRKI